MTLQQRYTQVTIKVYNATSVELRRAGNKVHIIKTKFGDREYIDLRFSPAGNTSMNIQLTLDAEPFLRAIADGDRSAAAILADWIEEHCEFRLGGLGDTYILPILRGV